ncbi:translation initiation factor IF-2-like [Cebus imitator]|uniref:translation initiation factor IF-2-like n=1 Tax=Cebus imitator TaxID=2715852 RepID=UPI001896B6FB|nr:translation initiation factor IF-2-like [Cebus imitator]
MSDLTAGLGWPRAPLRTWRTCGTPAPPPLSHSPGGVELPPPSPPQPACDRNPGTKRPGQPMAAGQRQAAANHRAPHAPSRPQRGAGKVRGGAVSGAAPYGARSRTLTWSSEDTLGVRGRASKELGSSLSHLKMEQGFIFEVCTCV